MHVANSAAAWGDVFLAPHPRSFSLRSRRWATATSAVYTLWIQLVRYMTGEFPYPVLNLLPHPHGIVGFTLLGLLLFVAAFAAARALKRLVDGAGPRRRRKTA